jgi:hypothetical protein
MTFELPDKPFILLAAELDHVWQREDRSADGLATFAERNPEMGLSRAVVDARADARAIAEARNFLLALSAREDDVRSLLAGLFADALHEASTARRAGRP